MSACLEELETRQRNPEASYTHHQRAPGVHWKAGSQALSQAFWIRLRVLTRTPVYSQRLGVRPASPKTPSESALNPRSGSRLTPAQNKGSHIWTVLSPSLPRSPNSKQSMASKLAICTFTSHISLLHPSVRTRQAPSCSRAFAIANLPKVSKACSFSTARFQLDAFSLEMSPDNSPPRFPQSPVLTPWTKPEDLLLICLLSATEKQSSTISSRPLCFLAPFPQLFLPLNFDEQTASCT